MNIRLFLLSIVLAPLSLCAMDGGQASRNFTSKQNLLDYLREVIIETTIEREKSYAEMLMTPVVGALALLRGPRDCTPVVPLTVIEPQKAALLAQCCITLQQQAQRGEPLTNLLFWGPSGCGKLHLARWFAQQTGFDYIIIDGYRLKEWVSPDRALEMIRVLARFAQNYHKKCIIIIKGAEVLTQPCPIKNNSGQNEVLFASFPCGHPNVMLMPLCLTQNSNDLDPIFRTRNFQEIHIPNPALNEAKIFIEQFFRDGWHIFTTASDTPPNIDTDVVSEEGFSWLASLVVQHNFSPRQIRQLMWRIWSKAACTAIFVLNRDIIQSALQETIDIYRVRL